MDADGNRLPEFEEVSTRDPEEAIDALLGPAIAATPVLTPEQFRAAYERLQASQGGGNLVEGSDEDVRHILLKNARKLAGKQGFQRFHVQLRARPERRGEEGVLLIAGMEGSSPVAWVWKTKEAYHAFGGDLLAGVRPRLITVPNKLGVTDGTPLIIESEPDVERILADPDPQPPQRINDRNRELWADYSPEQIRRILVYAYLAHPRAAVRIQTLEVAGNLADAPRLADLLVDRSKRVRAAAAEAIWDRSAASPPVETTLAFAIRVLHDEVKRTGLVTHMSAAQALEAIRLLQQTRPERSDDFNKWLIDAWVREDEPLAVQGFRLLDLHTREGTLAGPAESEARDIGAELDRAGGLHAMEAVRDAIRLGPGEAAVDELALSWQGVGPWPVAAAPETAPATEEPDEIVDQGSPEAVWAIGDMAALVGAPAPAPPAPSIAPSAPAPAPAPAGASNGLAIASLVLGIVSLPASCCYGFGGLMGIGALIVGLIARRQIRESAGTQQGDGLAIAGIVTGGVAIAASVLAVALFAIGFVGSLLEGQ